jgi:hypothetical protein
LNVLDFNNLEIKHHKLLNLISIDVQNDMIELMDSLFTQSDNNTFILLHPVFSRSPYQSDLFLTLCYLKLVDNLMKSSHKIEKILCNTKFEKEILNHKYRNLVVECNNIKNSKLKIFLDILKISIRSLYFTITKNSKRKVLSTNNDYILIDTFLTKKCINNNKISDRYYTDMLKYVDEKELNNIFFFPSISNFPSNKTISKIINNSNENLIIKHDYLILKDYVEVIIKLFQTSKIKYKSIYFHDFDITDLINNELKINRYNPSFFDALLNYKFIENLKYENVKIKCLIDWNENQAIDKGLILGMKTFYPQVITKGYQGYIISTDYNHYIKPSKLEIANNLIPDYIYVIGKNLRNRLKTNSKNLKVKVAPAYRLKNIFKESLNIKKSNSILVILPIGLSESINIISMIIDSGLLNHRSITLKAHPLVKFKDIISHFSSYKLKKFKITDENVNSLIQKHSITIGSGSTALVESLTRCTPVLLIANKNLIDNPIPISINPNIWKICYNYQELINNLSLLEEYLLTNFNDIQNDSHLIRANYFKKPTKELTSEFLGLKI